MYTIGGVPRNLKESEKMITLLEKGLQLNHHHPLGPGIRIYPTYIIYNITYTHLYYII